MTATESGSPPSGGLEADPAARPFRNLYGRRKGRPLRAGQQSRMSEDLPRLSLPGFEPEAISAGGSPVAPPPPLDPAALFPEARSLRMEIGFGGGEHLVACALAEPEVGFIGCEHFAQGVAKLLADLARRGGAENLRLAAGDARAVLDALPEASLERIYLLYPDPWPKRRHEERRFVSEANLDAMARVLEPGGELRLATDIVDYASRSLKMLEGRKDFAVHPDTRADWSRPWENWPGTRYEAKAKAAGRPQHYLIFTRL
ncbi:tRNA (guanosine(46)-N7)-methyltransferase TrmB [Neomegalonema sp.]|uniref:tRNA (guanosine(46)-N7)-methyltransferase TrmB n=1 Tax=Neomegalonema sp. TaxID=2039713 RepID=UPI00261FE98A|nr:tRNA (guanosine(46)-N7)-methyltransferase TrmB [Neomegalonema sp.]MDD2868920.1 tRNA (guanosine(46)-N7)-methyltransferase TrmB [Neomegalonema sp.]